MIIEERTILFRESKENELKRKKSFFFKKMSTFKQIHCFEKRKDVADRIRSKYPDRIPIIVEAAPNCRLPPLEKKKFLVPEEITLGKFICEIRKHIKLEPSQAIFLFINNNLLPTSLPLRSIDCRYRDLDGFVYLTYTGENTFGFNSLRF